MFESSSPTPPRPFALPPFVSHPQPHSLGGLSLMYPANYNTGYSAPRYNYAPQPQYYPPNYYPTQYRQTYQDLGDKIYSNVYPTHTTNVSRQGYVTNNYYPNTIDNVQYKDYVNNNYYQNLIRDQLVKRYWENNVTLPDIRQQLPDQRIDYPAQNYYGYGQLPFFNNYASYQQPSYGGYGQQPYGGYMQQPYGGYQQPSYNV